MPTTAVCPHNYKKEHAGSDDTIILPNFDVEMYLHKSVKSQKSRFSSELIPFSVLHNFEHKHLIALEKMYHNHMMRA